MGHPLAIEWCRKNKVQYQSNQELQAPQNNNNIDQPKDR
jgi:hypothetical protein